MENRESGQKRKHSGQIQVRSDLITHDIVLTKFTRPNMGGLELLGTAEGLVISLKNKMKMGIRSLSPFGPVLTNQGQGIGSLLI